MGGCPVEPSASLSTQFFDEAHLTLVVKIPCSTLLRRLALNSYVQHYTRLNDVVSANRSPVNVLWRSLAKYVDRLVVNVKLAIFTRMNIALEVP
jgi:hypothetical protein